MKSLKLWLLMLSVPVLFASCKKDNNSKKETCNIITTTLTGITPFNISYNSDGKIATITRDKDLKNFQYSGNTIVINETYAGAFLTKTIITLNGQGLPLNTKIESNPAGTEWSNYQYEYSGKEMVKQTYTTYAGGAPSILSISWTNGNPTTVVGSATTTYDYYTDKPAKPGDYWNVSQMIIGYTTIVPKNALKSTAYGGAINTFSYTYDADGKITSLVIDDGTPPFDAWTYQYQCN